MRLHKMLLQLMLCLLILAAMAATLATAQAKPGCPESCGSLSIPYPFGTRGGCYLDRSFLITCNDSYKPLLREGNIEVGDISLNGELQILTFPSYGCYNQSGELDHQSNASTRVSEFPISHTKNIFTAVGCDTYAFVQGSLGHNYTTGCMSICNGLDDVVNGSCSGIGCCQTPIPKGVRDFVVTLGSFYRHEYIREFNPCGFAFVVEADKYNFSSLDFQPNNFNLSALNSGGEIRRFPVVLDWAVGIGTCDEARKNGTYVCGNNATCYEADNGPGYRCNCSQGYRGNPYLPNGCQDIDECANEALNDCSHNCSNTNGSYSCFCPEGYHGDGKKGGLGCTANQNKLPGIMLTVGISIGLLVTFVIIALIYFGIKKRSITKLRENNYAKNGGIILQRLLSTSNLSVQATKIFKEDELKKATNNFNESNVIGEGGFGTVYKGIFADKRIIAIKKSKLLDEDQIEQFLHEFIILSQINHPNVVKLLGCCLETPVPLLVSEFITNKTLFYHLHDKGRASSMAWETRLRIATETAEALAHMHSTTQIIHRDIKSANILLNDDCTAKVSDFGISRFVPLDKTHLTTIVQGTLGYIDPEYFHSGNLTEKSDVYSFGVILVELLTGERAVSLDRPEKDRSLAMYFISSLKEDCLFQVLEDRVKSEGHADQLKGVAEVAKKCLKLKGEERPTMEEVKKELQAVRKFEMHSWVVNRPDLEEREPLLSEPVDLYGSSTSTKFDTLKSQAILQIDGGR